MSSEAISYVCVGSCNGLLAVSFSTEHGWSILAAVFFVFFVTVISGFAGFPVRNLIIKMRKKIFSPT